jgi:hypothetical protein
VAPFICTLLIQETGSKYIPAHYVIVTALMALGSLLYFRVKTASTTQIADTEVSTSEIKILKAI